MLQANAPLTESTLGNESVYSSSITGLFKVALPVEILGNVVRYYPPSTPQAGYIIDFIIESISCYFLSTAEVSTLTKQELFEKTSTIFLEKIASPNEADKTNFLGMMFVHKSVREYLNPLIEQCFPDLIPTRITSDCYVAVVNHLLESFFKDATI